MSYSPEVQAMIDKRAAEERTTGPSFPMPRLRHNGETGKWSIREIEEGDKLSAETKDFTDVNESGKWGGVVVRVAWLAQSKYKEGVPYQKKTREFTDFKNERIELLKQTFGEKGKTETVRTYANYAEFKDGTAYKDDEGNVTGSAYDLKVVLYVYHKARKQVIKLICGGSARSEWFEYMRNKPSGEPGMLSIPWKMSNPTAQLLSQIKTVFGTTASTTDKGLSYHRLSFSAVGMCNDEELKEVFEVEARIKAWVDGWNKVNAAKKMDESAGIVNAIDEHIGVESVEIGGAPKSMAHEPIDRPEDDIDLSQVPF